MDTPFIGMIALFAFNFAPKGWALCNGQLLQINLNQALFSLLGTYYGGNGTTNFALPNLQGRIPMHFGTGSEGSIYQIGQAAGGETATLLINNIPAHNHTLNAVSEAGDVSAPLGAFHANTGALDTDYKTSGTVVAMNTGAIGNSGGSEPFSILQPYLTLNYCIALQGIFPSRD